MKTLRELKDIKWISFFKIAAAILFLCVSVWLVLTFAVAISYTFPQVIDDVATLMNKKYYVETDHVSSFGAALEVSKESFFHWQGIYFTQFMDTWLIPVRDNWKIDLFRFRIIMVSFYIFFVVSVLFFIYALIRRIYGIKDSLICTIVSFAVFYFVFTAYIPWRENFYWYQGAVCYMFPLSIYLFTCACILMANMDMRLIMCIIFSIISFFAAGSALCIPGVGCYMLLLICLFDLKNKYKWIIFSSSTLGAVINVLAPGNYRRRDYIDSTGLHLGKMICVSAQDSINAFKVLFSEGFTPLIWGGVIIFILIGLGYKNEKINFKQIALLSVLILLFPFLIAFPVELGYSGGGLPNRVLFCEHFAVSGIVFLDSYFIGAFLSRKFSIVKVREKVMIFGVGIALVCFCIIQFNKNVYTERIVNINTFNELRAGVIPKFSEEVMELYTYLETTPEKDIVITKQPNPIWDFEKFVLTEDEKHGMWQKYCQYFEKQSIKYVPGND